MEKRQRSLWQALCMLRETFMAAPRMLHVRFCLHTAFSPSDSLRIAMFFGPFSSSVE